MNTLSKIATAAAHIIANRKIYLPLYQADKPQPLGFSFNLADRCPVGCRCYWRAQNRVVELSVGEVLEFFHARLAEGYLLATIVGGEPYVRPRLLERVCGILPATWVVTSGTTPLRPLNATQFVSIDGANAETHDAVRRSPGLYRRVMRNLTQARQSGIRNVYIHTVLNRLNFTQIPELVELWSSSGLVDGITFSTTTKIGDDTSMLLTRTSRGYVVSELSCMKERYGQFIVMTDFQIRALDFEHVLRQTPQTCPTARNVASFDAAGQKIQQCIFSELGDCSTCGCIITPMIAGLKAFDLATLRLLLRLYTPQETRK